MGVHVINLYIHNNRKFPNVIIVKMYQMLQDKKNFICNNSINVVKLIPFIDYKISITLKLTYFLSHI